MTEDKVLTIAAFVNGCICVIMAVAAVACIIRAVFWCSDDLKYYEKKCAGMCLYLLILGAIIAVWTAKESFGLAGIPVWNLILRLLEVET